jgi:CRP/FNR family cyclic AMP-dependent transcriptional regulator
MGGVSPLRHNGPVIDLLALAADLPVEPFEAGDVLIQQGTDPGRLLILASGTVTVERDGVPVALIDSPGAVFGEMAAVLGKGATATVRATTAGEVHVAADPDDFFMERPEATLAVLRTTAARLDGMTQYVVDIKSQFADAQGHLGMVDQILDTLLHHQVPPARPGSRRDPEGDHDHEH